MARSPVRPRSTDTDGIVEAFNARDEAEGAARLEEALRGSAGSAPRLAQRVKSTTSG